MYAKAHRLTEGWTAEKWLYHQLSSIPSAANIVNNPQGPIWTQGSPRRQSNLEVERLWFGVKSNMEVPGRSVRWMVKLIDSCLPVHSQLQVGSDFSTGRSSLPYLRFHYEVSQGEEDQGPSGMASTVSRYENYYWRTKLKNLEELWDACKVAFHAIPDDLINKTLPNRMATVLQAKGTHTIY